MADKAENPTNIALRSNWLTVDNKTLRADVLRTKRRADKLTVSAERFNRILLLGRQPILESLQNEWSIWAAHLGTTEQTDGPNTQVFTEKGYANNGDVLSRDEIKDEFHGYWDGVTNAGLIPRVRRVFGERDGGSWLFLKGPTLGEAARLWFGYDEDGERAGVRQLIEESNPYEPENKERIEKYHELGQQANEAEADSHDMGKSQHLHVGLILAMSSLKLCIKDNDGFNEEIDDALNLSRNSEFIGDDAVRAIENSAFDLP